MVRSSSVDYLSSLGSDTLTLLLLDPVKRTKLNDFRGIRVVRLRLVAVGCKTMLLMQE